MSSTPAHDGSERPDGTQYPEVRDEGAWREALAPDEYYVLRESGTEPPFVGEYTDTKTQGTYRCRACQAALFSSDSKFDSHCGWPSFFTPLAGDSVVLLQDRSLLSTRTEARCANCGSHLGHVFEGEGYETPTDQRWCINSLSITLDEVPDSDD
ncbi:MAG: peptide-methionine (R)-S-oxide reductase MsrB [Actinobacteria bacterium]|nr:peptide-methionine (R)-S-oxide reductase MsrB [Actinomycetota bacterium]